MIILIIIGMTIGGVIGRSLPINDALFGKAFEVLLLLLNLSILVFLVYYCLRTIRKRKEMFGRVGRLKGVLGIAFLLFVTFFFAMILAFAYFS